MKKRVACFDADCSYCRKRCDAGNVKSILTRPAKLYSCKTMHKKHTAISAKECEDFECERYGRYHFCKNCHQG